MNNSPDGSMDAVWSALRVLLISIGGVMAKDGLEHSGLYAWVMGASSAVLILGPAAWGVWTALQRAFQRKECTRVGVAAGLAAGQQGVTLAAPAVTHDDASEIIKTYSPATPGN